MTRKLARALGFFLLLATITATAQMRGGSGGMGQGGMGQGGMGQGGGMGAGTMGSPGMGRTTDMPGSGNTQMQQRRQKLHTTDAQDQMYRKYSQSMNRVRTRLRQMAKLTKPQSFDVSQAAQLQTQLSTDLQDMQTQLDDLVASLNDDQKNADQKQLDELVKNTKDLDAFSEELGKALDEEKADSGKVDSAKVREQVHKTENVAKQMEKEQRELATTLGIEP